MSGAAPPKNNNKLPKIILFGASLTQWAFEEDNRGFGWVLTQKYHDKAEVLNEGEAGYTSTMLIPNFKRIIERSVEPSAPRTLLFTIFVGANDAAILPSGPYVPLKRYEENMRYFVETILTQDNMPDTKIVLITPPPINIPNPPQTQDMEWYKETMKWKTYMSKKTYAEKIMEIAKEYGDETGRVAAVNLWKLLCDSALKDQGILGDEDAYHEDKSPGSGLKTAKAFEKGYFTDGLHFDGRAYDLLSNGLLDLISEKWPELAPDAVGA
ncbi:SGNH hydrolase [Aaosphaeria arxii CBS 175.79]|uniref:SGNH hydrolase n=1 Tax=Aaosphaeria arxii CBS 175.79 TaxID=1450172 RepID=A0A6A5Y5W4_9PLEO|nr:SGNH hydrolase [Aaosphaeria arxii CBS 175.79]KAF2019944.1 SGNH hydrolase [Aaosphaeria arxii CBS 175.79]